jgi:hypothetical protein
MREFQFFESIIEKDSYLSTKTLNIHTCNIFGLDLVFYVFKLFFKSYDKQKPKLLVSLQMQSWLTCFLNYS